MNKYELAVVVSAKIEDDERAQVIEKVKALVERFGGKISDVDESGKKRLAYEIQKMKEAYYYFIHFDAEADVPGEIEQRIRIMDKAISPSHMDTGIRSAKLFINILISAKQLHLRPYCPLIHAVKRKI